MRDTREPQMLNRSLATSAGHEAAFGDKLDLKLEEV